MKRTFLFGSCLMVPTLMIPPHVQLVKKLNLTCHKISLIDFFEGFQECLWSMAAAELFLCNKTCYDPLPEYRIDKHFYFFLPLVQSAIFIGDLWYACFLFNLITPKISPCQRGEKMTYFTGLIRKNLLYDSCWIIKVIP